MLPVWVTSLVTAFKGIIALQVKSFQGSEQNMTGNINWRLSFLINEVEAGLQDLYSISSSDNLDLCHWWGSTCWRVSPFLYHSASPEPLGWPGSLLHQMAEGLSLPRTGGGVWQGGIWDWSLDQKTCQLPGSSRVSYSHKAFISVGFVVDSPNSRDTHIPK